MNYPLRLTTKRHELFIVEITQLTGIVDGLMPVQANFFRV
jgi:hypothetical protein